MNCKKCGCPMGKKNYCAYCQPQRAQTEKKKSRLWLWLVIAAVCVAAVVTAVILLTGGKTDDPSTPAVSAGKHHVEIEVRDYGTITVELDADAAPITAENFLKLANEGFYDGLTFHRIMAGFMMQGGDPTGTGMGGSEETIKGEFSANGVRGDLHGAVASV